MGQEFIPYENKLNSLITELHQDGFEVMFVVARVSEEPTQTWTAGSTLGQLYLYKTPSVLEQFQQFCKDALEECQLIEDALTYSSSEAELTDDRNCEMLNTGMNMPSDSCGDTRLLESVDTRQSEEGHSSHNTAYEHDEKNDMLCMKSTVSGDPKTRDLLVLSKKNDQNAEKSSSTLIEFLRKFNGTQCIPNGSKCETYSDEEMPSSDLNVVNTHNSLSQSAGCTARVLTLYNSFKADQSKVQECLVCHNAKYSSIVKHIASHIQYLEETVVKVCKLCSVSLPEQYFGYHMCDHEGESDKMNLIVNNIWDDILFFEMNILPSKSKQMIACTICNVQHKTTMQYRKHLIQSHLLSYQCALCGDVKGSHSELLAHLRQHSSLSCLVCQKQFSNKRSLMHHMRKLHKGQMPKYSCNMCKKLFTSQARLINHKKTHKMTVKCDVESCNMAFHLQKGLEEHKIKCHRNLVDKNRPFLCNICGQQFLRKGNLTAHQEWKHKIGSPEKCAICQKVFSGRTTLTSHMRSHSTSQNYMCELCGVSYKQRSGLCLHRKRHHADPNTALQVFKCEICSKEFTRKRSFQHHIITSKHISETQVITEKDLFPCKTCGKVFGAKERWARHTLIHSSEAAFKCSVCGKGFVDKSNLRKHLQIHTGKRPQCNFCKKAFRSVRQLNEHTLSCQSTTEKTTAVTTTSENTAGKLQAGSSVFNNDLSVQQMTIEICDADSQDASISEGQYIVNFPLEEHPVPASLADEAVIHSDASTEGLDPSMVYEGHDTDLQGTSDDVMATNPDNYILLSIPTSESVEKVVPWDKC